WRYDITSAGIIRTPPTASGDGIDVALTRSDYAVLGSLAFVLVMIAWGLIHRAGTQEAAWRPVRDTGRPAIAVLPFADLSADGE
ncbi:MAG: hypothetical protein GWM87_14830, partial [Xanthomonadales bacterium]|nr:hypothetical protein [Xanthomonadales bacterium]NIX14069.1 hypothetical protein [Xanthomonadales bacterium]